MRLPCSYLAHLVIMSLLPFVKLRAGDRISFSDQVDGGGQMISWITLRFDPAAISGRLSGAAKHTRYSGPSFSSILGWAGVQISANKFLGFFWEFWILRNSSFRWRRSDIASWGGAGVQISANEFCFFLSGFKEFFISAEIERQSKAYSGFSPPTSLDWCTNICGQILEFLGMLLFRKTE